MSLCNVLTDFKCDRKRSFLLKPCIPVKFLIVMARAAYIINGLENKTLPYRPDRKYTSSFSVTNVEQPMFMSAVEGKPPTKDDFETLLLCLCWDMNTHREDKHFFSLYKFFWSGVLQNVCEYIGIEKAKSLYFHALRYEWFGRSVSSKNPSAWCAPASNWMKILEVLSRKALDIERQHTWNIVYSIADTS